MRANEFIENPELDEGIRDWIMAAGLSMAALGSADYILDYLGKSDPAVKQQMAQGKVQQAQAPSAAAKILATALNPLEKKLVNAATAAGIKGEELKQFLAQAKHESWDFKHMEEQGTEKYFAKKYDRKYNPGKAKILGNTQIGDGARFKGRGFFQLTGRYNYTKAGEALGIDLVNKPQLAANPDLAAKIAVWFWKNRVQSKVDDFTDTAASTKPINPALHGLQSRQSNYDQYVSRATDSKKL